MQLDIGIITLVLLLTLLGFLKGFWSQIISIVAAVVGGLTVYFARGAVSEYLFKLVTEKYPEIDIDISVIQFVSAIFIFVFAYFIAGIILEMIKRRFLISLSLKLSDRLFGLIAGAIKGCAVALVVILIMIISKNYVKSFTSEDGYEHYLNWLNNSKAYHISQDVFIEIEKRMPWFKDTMARLNVTFEANKNNEDSDVWE